MPNVTFSVDTQATISRFEVRVNGTSQPVNHNNGTGTANFASGFRSVCTLVLQGQQNQKAKLKITQTVSGLQVILAERSHIKITSPSGETTANVDFVVR